jgi:5-methylcytosine-specific restriction endonuclease McrA
MEKPAPIELDHINGNHHDNRLENLRILCPNCHAQTDTYRGKNKK